MIVAKITVLWQVKNGLIWSNLVSSLVVDFDTRVHDKEDRLDTGRVAYDWGAVLKLQATKQLDDEFVDEALFTLVEEVAEVALKAAELVSLLDDLGLQAVRHLVEKGKLLDGDVEVKLVSHVEVCL